MRLFDPQFKQIAIHARREPGRFATDQRHIAPEKRGGLEPRAVWWLRKAQAIGPEAGRWAETLLARRGIHALRAVMGLVSLTQRHASGAVEQALLRRPRPCRLATARPAQSAQTPGAAPAGAIRVHHRAPADPVLVGLRPAGAFRLRGAARMKKDQKRLLPLRRAPGETSHE
ncbi:MAG: hypothetical protein IPM64_16755 [Phycisphaerales bacterium]|nr:hypothetical protein [Phycisphaerales bacterium]